MIGRCIPPLADRVGTDYSDPSGTNFIFYPDFGPFYMENGWTFARPPDEEAGMFGLRVNKRESIPAGAWVGMVGMSFLIGCQGESTGPEVDGRLGTGLYACDAEAGFDVEDFRQTLLIPKASCLKAEEEFIPFMRITLEEIPAGANRVRTVVIDDGCTEVMREYVDSLRLSEATPPRALLNPEPPPDYQSSGTPFRTGVYHVNLEYLGDAGPLGISKSTIGIIMAGDEACLAPADGTGE